MQYFLRVCPGQVISLCLWEPTDQTSSRNRHASKKICQIQNLYYGLLSMNFCTRSFCVVLFRSVPISEQIKRRLEILALNWKVVDLYYYSTVFYLEPLCQPLVVRLTGLPWPSSLLTLTYNPRRKGYLRRLAFGDPKLSFITYKLSGVEIDAMKVRSTFFWSQAYF